MKHLYPLFTFLATLCSFNAMSQAPVNDDPCSATTLTVGASCNYSQFSNVAATGSSVPVSGCGNYVSGDVWFSVLVPSSGSLQLNANAGTMTDGAMAVYTGTCNALNLHSCDD